ncbi:ATP-binding protein [Pseudomonas fulva]|uniref:ATP-binding protein n=1 Tax=Pseudomonas fulva TaxID=47880 RepID=UPI00382F874A
MSEESDTQLAQATLVDTLRLEVHPSVVFKLGADLITDDMQALIELVKNSYDADATKVRVEIDTEVLTDPETGETIESPLNPADHKNEETTEPLKKNEPEPLKGLIRIIDDGIGMDLETIRKGWLTVSLSHKQLMKELKQTTAKERTPLGDKGLGRLGAQRLGEVITLTTRKEGSKKIEENIPDSPNPTLKVSIGWKRFASADNLSSVPIKVERLPIERKIGTTLEIRGLRDPEFWKSGETNELQKELASMISPYEGVSGFKMSLSIDGQKVNLRETAQSILSTSPLNYIFNFDGSSITIKGHFRTEFLRPQKNEDIAIFDKLIGNDNGYKFSEWLETTKNKSSVPLGVRPGNDYYFLLSTATFSLSEIKGVELADGNPVNPGPFHGEVSGISLKNDTKSIFDRASEYREFVRALVGIKVYRDGFGVRVDDDWLNLGAQWTSGASYYTLRPGNVTGYVNISAKDNAALQETTNREAFRDTPAYRNFYKLLSAWADYTGRVQEYIRRSYNEFKNLHLADQANVEVISTPETLVKKAGSQIEHIAQLARKTADARHSLQRIQSATDALEKQRKTSGNTLFQDPELQRAVDLAVQQVNNARHEADSLIRGLDQLLEEQDRLKAGIDLLSSQIEIAQSQIGDAWESVALGLSAESLAHEVQHISDGLRGRSSQITQYLKSISLKDQRIWTFVEHVRSSAATLAKQTSRLAPALRHVRENKENIITSDIIKKIAEYHSGRWGANGVSIELNILSDFEVRLNPGRLTQVLDNLILNSEYWLLQSIRTRKIDSGKILITIDRPFLILEDNGIGIDPSIEELIFEPFITSKPSQQGRGLGLFVVRQLLDAEQASITLTTERNKFGRRNQFLINFSGCISSNVAFDPVRRP